MRALCVSIHDVAPQTLPLCRQIADAVDQLNLAIPLTLLVVPRYHGQDSQDARDFKTWIDTRLQRGDELALHGYTHRDEAAPRNALFDRWRRGVYTAGEGEFAALTKSEAASRIALGRGWLAERGWRAKGFVAPAWLLSAGAWSALRETDFLYTTTLTRFYLLRHGRSALAPTFTYSTRNASRRVASRIWNDLLAIASARAPVVRFGFHPADAEHRELMRHALSSLERVGDRCAMTKSAWAEAMS